MPSLAPPPEELVSLRHELHRLAETAGQEVRTAARVRDYLQTYPPDELITGIGGHGLAAVYRGTTAGPRVLIRADLDALPIGEEHLDLPYLAEQAGNGHKCGHDGHTTMAAGLAPRLHAQRPATGEVVLLFQPAEETGQGACRVVGDPKFKAIRPDYAFGLHNLPEQKLGTVCWRKGAFAAASVGMRIKLKGASAHAAHPELATEPRPVLIKLLNDLPHLPQEMPSEFDGIFALLTIVGARLGGENFGTTPGDAALFATLRSTSDEALAWLREHAQAMLENEAPAHGIRATHEWIEHFPATICTDEEILLVKDVAEANGLLTRELDRPRRWSEDFGWFLRESKGAMFGLGTGEQQPPLHHPDYDFPDALIPYGVQVFEGIVRRLLD